MTFNWFLTAVFLQNSTRTLRKVKVRLCARCISSKSSFCSIPIHCVCFKSYFIQQRMGLLRFSFNVGELRVNIIM